MCGVWCVVCDMTSVPGSINKLQPLQYKPPPFVGGVYTVKEAPQPSWVQNRSVNSHLSCMRGYADISISFRVVRKEYDSTTTGRQKNMEREYVHIHVRQSTFGIDRILEDFRMRTSHKYNVVFLVGSDLSRQNNGRLRCLWQRLARVLAHNENPYSWTSS